MLEERWLCIEPSQCAVHRAVIQSGGDVRGCRANEIGVGIVLDVDDCVRRRRLQDSEIRQFHRESAGQGLQVLRTF